jgi:hypothetical protein
MADEKDSAYPGILLALQNVTGVDGTLMAR